MIYNVNKLAKLVQVEHGDNSYTYTKVSKLLDDIIGKSSKKEIHQLMEIIKRENEVTISKLKKLASKCSK